MKQLISMVALLTCLVILLGPVTAQEQKKTLVMPRELVELAEKNGYKQVDNFFDVTNDGEGPSFVYGDLDSSVTGAARAVAFWCRKNADSAKEDESYYLILASRKFWMAQLEIDAVASNMIPGGLYLCRDSSLTLDSFVYVDDERTHGPSNTRMKCVAFRALYDGDAETYYMYQGRWLVFREWDW